jgi:tetratricopeptide (TPR) repeat protein
MRRFMVIVILGLAVQAPGVEAAGLPSFDTLWNYDQPAETEAKFRALLPEALKADDIGYRAELMTQIARTLGLQERFEAAHAVLDSVQILLPKAPKQAMVRYLLERGRVFNSSNQEERAMPLFAEAWEEAQKAGLDAYAVDAAHMLAIASPDEERLSWNLKGVELARSSADPKARRWLGSLYNNIGWNLFDQKQYDRALVMFERALAARVEEGKPKETAISKWCIAKTYRMMGQVDTAFAIQRGLVQEMESSSEARDGYVYEEFAECLLALKRGADAVQYFAKAYFLLAEDPWLVRDEPERLARLKKLGEVK